jgi:hypothetical protein
MSIFISRGLVELNSNHAICALLLQIFPLE